jgi:hypothetical protein
MYKINLLKRTGLLLLIFVVSISCGDNDLDIDAPACIEQKIEEIIDKEVANPPTQVWRWEADGQIFYYITSDCCDQYNYLYSENCETICAPDGGISGEGDGNCPEFTSEIQKTLIWEDRRN